MSVLRGIPCIENEHLAFPIGSGRDLQKVFALTMCPLYGGVR